MFSGSFERLLSASRATGDGFNMPSAYANAFQGGGGITPLSNALQNETDAYFKTLQAGADGAGRVANPILMNRAIPGMNIGNELGVAQTVTGGAQTSQLFPIGKQQIPAVTLDGGKTYFDPRDGSPIDMNSLQPKDFFTDFGQGVKAIKEAKEKGGTYMNEETRKMMEMLEGS